MRAAWLLMALHLGPAVGCASILADSGTKLLELRDRDQVHKVFGTPVSIEQTDWSDYEEFNTRRKIAEPHDSLFFFMGNAVTFGLGEVVWFPLEVSRTVARSVTGCRLCFTYDKNGNVTAIHLDGQRVSNQFGF